MRRLGRTAVNVMGYEYDSLLKSGAVEDHAAEGYGILLNMDAYSAECGLNVRCEGWRRSLHEQRPNNDGVVRARLIPCKHTSAYFNPRIVRSLNDSHIHGLLRHYYDSCDLHNCQAKCGIRGLSRKNH